MGSFDADIRLVKGQTLSPIYTGEQDALDMEVVELGVAVVKPIKVDIAGGDPGALQNYPPRLVGGILVLFHGWIETPGRVPVRCDIENMDGLLLHVPGPLRGREEKGRGNTDR